MKTEPNKRVVRGGCRGNYDNFLRSAYRSAGPPDNDSCSLGFRLVIQGEKE